ncbi:TPA: hypothetical protein ACJGUQ_004545 [Salmonella enterica subsp. enterica serovar Ball]
MINEIYKYISLKEKSGTLDYHTAATHFSASTGLTIQASYVISENVKPLFEHGLRMPEHAAFSV